jgi:hypothetical protein
MAGHKEGDPMVHHDLCLASLAFYVNDMLPFLLILSVSAEKQYLNWFKAIWFDRSWLGKSQADIHNFFKLCPTSF